MSGRFVCCGTYHDHTLVSQRETITVHTTPRLNVNRTNKLLSPPAVFSYTEYSYLCTDEYEFFVITLKYRPFSILEFLIYFHPSLFHSLRYSLYLSLGDTFCHDLLWPLHLRPPIHPKTVSIPLSCLPS
jgi:hypothetical protein